MKYLLTIAILFSSSACMIPAYTTKHGIKVYDKTTFYMPTVNETERVVSYAIRYLGSAKKLDGTKLMYVNVWIEIPGYKNESPGWADGHIDIWHKEIIASVFQESCLADSGLLHELAHVYHDYGKLVPDWWHEDKDYWNWIKMIEKQIVTDLCPGYVHVDHPPPARSLKKE